MNDRESNSPRYRLPRRMSKAEKEHLNFFFEEILFFIVGGICAVIIFIWVSILALILILEFLIKTIILIIRKFNNKEVKVFKVTEFERKNVGLMRKSFDFLVNLSLHHNKKRTTKAEEEDRTCVICGNPLRTRRKYCSECRPSGRALPYDENNC